jgi:multimeric flavodoxin WrbA
MKILCISAANTVFMGGNSASIKVCNLIKKIVEEEQIQASTEIVSLVNYDLKFCRLCGDCCKDSKCKYDAAFNELFSKINDADVFFFVVPHYSPIPSKLLALFEKINEIIYASWSKDNDYTASFLNKPVGIIGHGGMPENEKILKYYHNNLITPVSNTLKSLSFRVIGLNEEYINGIAFGLENENCLVDSKDSVFPDILHNWDRIEERIKPLIKKVVAG